MSTWSMLWEQVLVLGAIIWPWPVICLGIAGAAALVADCASHKCGWPYRPHREYVSPHFCKWVAAEGIAGGVAVLASAAAFVLLLVNIISSALTLIPEWPWWANLLVFFGGLSLIFWFVMALEKAESAPIRPGILSDILDDLADRTADRIVAKRKFPGER